MAARNSASPTFSPRQSLSTETRPIWPSGSRRAVPIGYSPARARKCTASASSASHSSSGGTACSAINTVSRMRRRSALSFCQSARRTCISLISKLQAALFDQFNQQVTPFVIGEPRTEVFDMQGIGRAHQFQQLTQVGREQTALAAGEQHQVVTDFRPGHARAGVADQYRAIFQASEEAFFVDLDAGNQLRVLGLGHKLAEPGHQQALIAHVLGEQSLEAIQGVALDLRRVAGRLRIGVAVALFVRQELAEKIGEMGENFSGAWRTEAYGIRHTVILSGTTVGQKRRQIEHVAGLQNPFFSFNEFSKDL